MRIDAVDVFLHERAWHLSGDAFGSVPHDVMPMGVLRIRTDAGVDGHAFVSGPGPSAPPACRDIAQVLRPYLLGQDPLDIGAIWHDLWPRTQHKTDARIDPLAVGAIDVALWDIAGRVAGLPVHRLLGTCRDRLPAYISSWVHRTPRDYADEVLHWVDDGWAGYKLHPPTQWRKRGEQVDVALDVACCAAIREAVGDEVMLMLDSACAYDFDEALTVGRAIGELRYSWFEDPLGAEDIDGYARLLPALDGLGLSVIATEITSGGLHALPMWAARGATHALRGDVMLKGGITGMVKIAHLAEAFGLPCEIHDGFNGLGNVACLHVALAAANCSMFEVLTINPTGTYDVDHLSYGLTEPIAFDRGRCALAPSAPGLGHVPDWDLLLRSGGYV